MGLTCECGGDYGDSYWRDHGDYEPLSTKRSRRCCSCNTKIKPGETSMLFERYRAPKDEPPYIEERIYGDEVPLAHKYMCETCADLFLSLEELGFCINLGDDMRKLVREYAELYGRKSA